MQRLLPIILMNETTNLKKQFLSSLKCGTGRAYVIAKNNKNIDFTNQIIKGVIKNFAYDGQCEENRANYIFELIKLSKNQEKIKEVLFERLKDEQSDTWTLTHLFALAKLFAQNGDKKAKKNIYKRYFKKIIPGCDWVGAYEIIRLDGIDGLEFIAEKNGEYLQKNPTNLVDDSLIDYCQEQYPKLNIRKVLNDIAKSNSKIRAFLNAVDSTVKERKNYKPKPKIYSNIIEETLDSKIGLYPRRIKQLTKNEINKLGKQLQIEKSKENQSKILSIFRYHTYPFDCDVILNILKQKGCDSILRERAISALSLIRDQQARNYFKDKLSNTKNIEPFIDILKSNYRKEDKNLLIYLASRARNQHKIEVIASSILDIYSNNKTKDCKEPLEILYSKMNCAICRNKVIKILIENKVLSKKIHSEIKYDCYDKTRELYYNKNGI